MWNLISGIKGIIREFKLNSAFRDGYKGYTNKHKEGSELYEEHKRGRDTRIESDKSECDSLYEMVCKSHSISKDEFSKLTLPIYGKMGYLREFISKIIRTKDKGGKSCEISMGTPLFAGNYSKEIKILNYLGYKAEEKTHGYGQYSRLCIEIKW